MPDQAEHLRSLVQAAPGVRAKPAVKGTPLVVVTGSRKGVGATTVAVNVGAVLADRGTRVLVVDAAGERSNMMEIAGVHSASKFTLSDASTGKCDAADAIVAGASGMKLLSALGCLPTRRESVSPPRRIFDRRGAATSRQELLAALKPLREEFDVMVIDAGAGLSRLARRLWLRAQLVLLVTSGDDAAVMDAYAALKRHVAGARDAMCANVRLLVNQAESDRMAEDAQRRLANCCQQFLRQRVAAAPSLPRWEGCEDASVGSHPRVWEAPNSQFGHAVLWLGRSVEDALATSALVACATARDWRKVVPTSHGTACCPTFNNA